MNALDVMIACRAHSREKAHLEERLEDMEAAMTSLAIRPDTPVQGGGGDGYAAYTARRDDVERQIKALGKLLAAESTAVILLTEALPAIQRRSLRDFYAQGQGATHIARYYGYTVSNIYKALHAGREAARLIPEDKVAAALPVWYLQHKEEENA